MKNELMVFENENFGKVRTLQHVEGEIYFVARDVSEVLGYKKLDAMYRRLSDKQKLKINPQTLNSIGFPYADTSQFEPNKNIKTMVLLTESGLYKAILGSTIPKAEKFQDWVTDEVLPSIRKHGMYITENKVEEILSDPDVMIGLLEEIKKERAEKKALVSVNSALVEEIEINKPLVEYANQVASSSDSVDMGTFAKLIYDEDIKLGRNKLFKLLRDKGVLQKDNEPYQRHVTNGYFKLIPVTFETPYGTKVGKKVLVTGKGQIKLVSKLKEWVK